MNTTDTQPKKPTPKGLIPWKAGDPSPNPKGRPRGSKNRSTVLAELADMAIQGKDINDHPAQMSVEKAVITSLVRKGLTGDVAAIKEIQDTLYGKVADRNEISGPNGGPIETALPEQDRAILDHYFKTKGKDNERP